MIRAGELRCCTCRSPLADVAPDFDVLLPDISEQWIDATCVNGHRLMIHATRDERGHDRIDVSPIAKPEALVETPVIGGVQ